MPDTISIGVGSLDRRYPTQKVDSLAFVRHPKYTGSSTCEDYDYALILTRTDFDFSRPNVQPIKIAGIISKILTNYFDIFLQLENL